MPERSWLFTPGSRPDRFAKGADSGADVLIIDLEDAVAPSDKTRARAAAFAYASAKTNPIRLALRINGLDTLAGLTDLQALSAAARFDYIIVPKTESAAHLRIVDSLLTEAGNTARIVALVESARGLAAADEIAAAVPRLCALVFGAADMAADLGATAAWAPLAYARGQLVIACAQAGIPAIDAPCFTIDDAACLAQETEAAAAMGFAAKAAIHPGQVAVINAILTPSEAALETAHRILRACETGAGQIDGRMVDAAMARNARRILAQAKAGNTE